jgi:hypothetical protein
MGGQFWIVVSIAAAMVTFWHVAYRYGMRQKLIADAWHIRKQAFTGRPVSAPYCWRPFVPWLGRHFGFHSVAVLCCFASALVLYFYLGRGWAACAVAIAFVGNRHIVPWCLCNPENAEAVGHLLLISCLYALSTGSWLVYPLAFLAVMTRESLGAVVGCIALLTNPWALLPVAMGGALAYFRRREDHENHHPLVKETAWKTAKHWLEVKRTEVYSWSNVLAPTRGAMLAVPWMWSGVTDYQRLALIAVPVVWLFSIPASGAQRINSYAFALFAPFVVALGVEWCWTYAALSWLWPIDFTLYDECGNSNNPAFRSYR